MVVSTRNCPQCNSPVTIADGINETFCSQCGHRFSLDAGKSKRWGGWIRKPIYQVCILILLLAMLGGIWGYVVNRNTGDYSNWIEYIGGDSRVSAVDKSDFSLYELHGDDTVRIIRMINISGAKGFQVVMAGPCLDSYSDTLTVDAINAQLVNQFESGAKSCYYYEYLMNVSNDHFGYDILTDKGYLRVFRETERLFTIGCDPNPYIDQSIIAVAIPQTANITSMVFYGPYRHVQSEGWDIFYYDVTDIRNHVSIQIYYEPGVDAPKLDRAEVEAAR